MKKLKKLLVTVLSVTLISSMIPLAAFANTGQEGKSEPVVIDRIDINNLEMPEEGNFTDYEASVPEDAHYHFMTNEQLDTVQIPTGAQRYYHNGICWWFVAGVNTIEMEKNSKYEKGVSYFATFMIEADEGYVISEDAEIYINGKNNNIQYQQLGRRKATDEYPNGNWDKRTIFARSYDYRVADPDEAVYKVNIENGRAVNFNGDEITTAPEGVEVFIYPDVSPKGCTFDYWEIVSPNGLRVTSSEANRMGNFTMVDSDITIRAKYKKALEINSVNIDGVEFPAYNNFPDTDIILAGQDIHHMMANYHYAVAYNIDIENPDDDIRWIKSDGKVLQPNKFISDFDKTYCGQIVLKPEKGYCFAENLELKINGETQNIDMEKTEIAPDYINLYTKENLLKTNDTRRNINIIGGTAYNLIGEEITKAALKERIIIKADEKEGYDFCGWVSMDKVEFEDPLATETSFPMKSKDITIEATYQKTPEAISSVEVDRIILPTYEKNVPYTLSLDKDAKYHVVREEEELLNAGIPDANDYFNGICWYDSKGSLDSSQTHFKEDDYYAVIALKGKAGYAFKSLPEKVTINGHESLVESCEVKKGILLIKTKTLKAGADSKHLENQDISLGENFVRTSATVFKCAVGKSGEEIKPVIRDEDGRLLEEGIDYLVVMESGDLKKTGEARVEVTGMLTTNGTVTYDVIMTPEPVTSVKVRPTTASGGYDDAYITWNKSEGATGYMVYARRPSKTSKWTSLGRTDKTSFLEKDLYDGWKYEFKVIPYYEYQDVRYRTTEDYQKASMFTMKKIAKPSVKKYNSSRVKISWSDISGESGYQVRAHRKDKTSYFVTTGNSINLKVIKNRNYSYKVRAYKNVVKGGKTVKVYGPWSDYTSYTLK